MERQTICLHPATPLLECRSNSSPVLRKKESGFTLTELMVTIVILALLTAAALPSFRPFIVGQRIKSASFDIMSTLMLARSEAIKRNTNVLVTPASGSWLNGWAVSVGGTTLSQQAALGNGLAIACYSPGPTVTPCVTLTYASNGRILPGSTAPSIQLSSTDPNANAAVTTRCIGIDLSGRPNSKKGNC